MGHLAVLGTYFYVLPWACVSFFFPSSSDHLNSVYSLADLDGPSIAIVISIVVNAIGGLSIIALLGNSQRLGPLQASGVGLRAYVPTLMAGAVMGLSAVVISLLFIPLLLLLRQFPDTYWTAFIIMAVCALLLIFATVVVLILAAFAVSMAVIVLERTMNPLRAVGRTVSLMRPALGSLGTHMFLLLLVQILIGALVIDGSTHNQIFLVRWIFWASLTVPSSILFAAIYVATYRQLTSSADGRGLNPSAKGWRSSLGAANPVAASASKHVSSSGLEDPTLDVPATSASRQSSDQVFSSPEPPNESNPKPELILRNSKDKENFSNAQKGINWGRGLARIFWVTSVTYWLVALIIVMPHLIESFWFVDINNFFPSECIEFSRHYPENNAQMSPETVAFCEAELSRLEAVRRQDWIDWAQNTGVGLIVLVVFPFVLAGLLTAIFFVVSRVGRWIWGGFIEKV